MDLVAGTRLDHYEISGPLGAGGMGEVYRARDTKLERNVALKILPEQFAGDPERLARFEREAKVLASLNHANIAAIYGLGHATGVPGAGASGVRFLVLELVEGPTLSERLNSGRIEPREALRIAADVAAAIESAHEAGVLHRDLKPGNIKLTKDGGVKVLDFGLAKAFGDSPQATDPTNSPTMTGATTREGIILGTAAYMSPEQANGEILDKRTDIWSFGVILYEMLAGRRAFEGKTTSHILVHVMEQEPDWAAIPPLPSGVRELLEGCLRKDRNTRLRDIGDVRVQLQAAATKRVEAAGRTPVDAGAPRGRSWALVAAAVIVLAVTGVVVAVIATRDAAPPAEAVQFEIAQPEDANLNSAMSVSPDGRRVAFLATSTDGQTSLWIRTLETLESRRIAGTEGAAGFPFWSPNSQTVVFMSGFALRKVDASGGPVQTLTEVEGSALLLSGFWTEDDQIVFGMLGTGLLRVPAAGGLPVSVTLLDGSGTHAFPSLLPDGYRFVFSKFDDDSGIFLGSLEPEADRPIRILPDESPVMFAASRNAGTGYLLFQRGAATAFAPGTLMAQPFDVRRLAVAGDAIPIAEDVPSGGFSASPTGVLVHGVGQTNLAAAFNTGTRGLMTWFDRSGKVLGTAGDVQSYDLGVMLAPDDTRVAYSRDGDIWVFEFERGTETKLTFDPDADVSPAWSADGEKITWVSDRGGTWKVYEKAADGTGTEELLYDSGTSDLSRSFVPNLWSPDDRVLFGYNGGTDGNVWALSREGTAEERVPIALVDGPNSERGARTSSSGRYFSYTSNETGIDQAFVRPFDGETISSSGGQWMISPSGGASPKWRDDEREMFYHAPDGTIMSVEITTDPTFRPLGTPTPLFRGPAGVIFWDVTGDGERFLIPAPPALTSQTPYRVILNWTATIEP